MAIDTAAIDRVVRQAMKAWKEGSEFQANLLADPQVRKYLTPKELDKLFDLDYYLRNIGKIFRKVGLSR